MTQPGLLEIDRLEAYEVSSDGSVRLGLVDARGRAVGLALAFENLRALATLLPKLVGEASAAAGAGPCAVQDVTEWTVREGRDGKVIFTFSTGDAQASYAVRENEIHKMAELIVDHEVEAYPQGIEFH